MVVRKRRRKNNYGYRKKTILDMFGINTWLIIFSSIISIFGFLYLAFDPGFLDYLALNPSNILQGMFLWTIILHMFVHGNFLHLFVNMFVLFSLGGLTERIIGKKRFFWFYIVSGIFAGLLSVILAGYLGFGVGERIFGSPNIPMVGASGAIFAIAGLLMVLLPNLRFSIIFLPFFSLKAYVMIPLVLFGVWILSAIPKICLIGPICVGDWPIGNVAHFGGFLVGVVYGFYLRKRYRKKVYMLQRMFK